MLASLIFLLLSPAVEYTQQEKLAFLDEPCKTPYAKTDIEDAAREYKVPASMIFAVLEGLTDCKSYFMKWNKSHEVFMQGTLSQISISEDISKKAFTKSPAYVVAEQIQMVSKRFIVKPNDPLVIMSFMFGVKDLESCFYMKPSKDELEKWALDHPRRCRTKEISHSDFLGLLSFLHS